MKTFAILESPSSDFSAIVLSIGVTAPNEDMDSVATDLRDMHVSGRVVFDFLTANGTKTRRFFYADFNGVEFTNCKFNLVDPDLSVKQASARFLKSHLPEVDLTLLSPAMRFAVTKGIPL